MDIEVCTCVAKALAEVPCKGGEALLSPVRLNSGLGMPLTLLHGAPEPLSSLQYCTPNRAEQSRSSPTPGCDESGTCGGGAEGRDQLGD